MENGINWRVRSSNAAKNCRNYIRQIVDTLDLEPNPSKSVIALSIGDPTVYGNLAPPKEVTEAIIEATESGKCNGYVPCVGTQNAREAVAEYLSVDGIQMQASDVILCSGCSSALDLCITVLCDGKRGDNILLPKPGFPIYRTLAESLGVEVKYYNLIPEKDWIVDLDSLESQIDQNTAAIVINNPSNPCGSVFDEQHVRDILMIAEKKKVPIIADEIYERLVFSGHPFTSVAAIDHGVPILICGGLAKRFLVPGWRLGWIVINDRDGIFDDEVRGGLNCLTQRIIGSNTLVQGALPHLLTKTPQSFHDNLIDYLQKMAKLTYMALCEVQGLEPTMPQGAMYMMVKIDLDHFPQFKSGLDFTSCLMAEESVFCLPGECFECNGYMRLVLTLPEDLMKEACQRMSEFCQKYFTS